jgi:hypothetical protein
MIGWGTIGARHLKDENGPAPGVAAFRLAHFPIRTEAPSAKPLSGRQTKPNKSKENQGKPRKKAWISLDSFGRIGTFQRVTANPNKKILCGLGL